MADYHASIRSNYFHVKATDEFEAWLSDLAYGEITTFSDATDGTVGFSGIAPSRPMTTMAKRSTSSVNSPPTFPPARSQSSLKTEIDLKDIYAQAQDEFLGSNPIHEAW